MDSIIQLAHLSVPTGSITQREKCLKQMDAIILWDSF